MDKKPIRQLFRVGYLADESVVLPLLNGNLTFVSRGRAAANWLQKLGVDSSAIFLLENLSTPDSLHERIESLFADTSFTATESLLYVSPVYPSGIDIPGQMLTERAETVHTITGFDPFSALEWRGLQPCNGSLQIVDQLGAATSRYPLYNPALPAILHTSGMNRDDTFLRTALLQVYPRQFKILVWRGEDVERIVWHSIELGDWIDQKEDCQALFVPPLSVTASMESFMELIAHLRAPDGCPWDRKQTHETLRRYLLEETYEAIEALDQGDVEALREELGDLLLQIALHAQIGAENGEFDFTHIVQGISQKIITRHPHVFGDVNVHNEQDVLQNWEKLKEIERQENGKVEKNGLLDGIPSILPALSQAQTIQDRAARVGFDWLEISPVVEKILEELEEVKTAENDGEREKELGDLLFAVVNLTRWFKTDAETALRLTNNKFRRRFAFIESEAKRSGRALSEMTLAEMDALWETAKEFDE